MTWDLSEDEANGVLMSVNRILQGSYTAEGIGLWWDRPRNQLGGKTPSEVLHQKPMDVVDLALSSLGQIAT